MRKKPIRRLAGEPHPQGLYDPRFEHDSCGVGFVVNVKGRKSNQIVRDALTVLLNLRHRGACGCESNTGDGAGILLQMPHVFMKKVCAGAKIRLPAPDEYGVATVFLSPYASERQQCQKAFEEIVKAEGQRFLGWRTVPTNHANVGATARAAAPDICQAFI